MIHELLQNRREQNNLSEQIGSGVARLVSKIDLALQESFPIQK